MLIHRPIPNSDWVLSSQDLKAGELVTLAQHCIWTTGHSELARVLNAGNDPHADLGTLLLGVSYDEFIKRKKERKFKDTRQAMKPPNFGFGGGMAEVRLVHQQREQGPDTPCPNGPSMVRDDDGKLVPGYKGLRFCILMGVTDRCGAPGRKTTTYKDQIIAPTCVDCLECGARVREIWKRKWPEMRAHFNYTSDCIERGMIITRAALERWPWLQEWYRPGQQLAPGEVMRHHSGIIRGGLDFCSAANGWFQALLARASKMAYRIATRECHDPTIRVPDMLFWNSRRSAYAGGQSPLYGSHIPVFQHDEHLCEHPRSIAHEAATRDSEIMRDCLRFVCPDLADAAEAEPTLMECWDKRASKVVHGDRLVPWTANHDDRTCGECKSQKARDDARRAVA